MRHVSAIVAVLVLSLVGDLHGQSMPSGASSPKSGPQTIADNLNSSDLAMQQEGLRLLEEFTSNAPRQVRKELASRWFKPLMRCKMYDEVEKIAIPGILSGPEDTKGVSSVQGCRVQSFLAARKYDQALDAGKAFYNVCRLDDTQQAIDLMIDVLANSRAKQDESIVRRFKQQQTAEGQTADSENVLKTIKVDATPWKAAIGTLAAEPVSFTNLTAKGNLLLLADQPKDARKAFELAIDLAGSKQMPDAVANVARAIRAEDGSITRANAYILSLRQQQEK